MDVWREKNGATTQTEVRVSIVKIKTLPHTHHDLPPKNNYNGIAELPVAAHSRS